MQAQDLHEIDRHSIRFPWRQAAPGSVHHLPDGQIVCCNAIDFLGSVKDETADILFLDPPFNLGKKYGSKDRKADLLNESEYMMFMTHVLDCAVDVVKPGGALYLYHLPRWAFQFANLLQQRMSFRHWIAISMKNGFARGQRLYPAHYALLYFTKGAPASFERPKIAPPVCRHCDRHLKDYGGYKHYVRDGINLSDVWDDLSPVRHSKYKTRKANELPTKLISRVLAISGFPHGVFLDPFVGSGTTLVAAREHGMFFVGNDYDQETCDLTYRRLTVSSDTL